MADRHIRVSALAAAVAKGHTNLREQSGGEMISDTKEYKTGKDGNLGKNMFDKRILLMRDIKLTFN